MIEDSVFDPEIDPAHNDDSQPSVTNSRQVMALADGVAAGAPLEAVPSLEEPQEAVSDEAEDDGLEDLLKADLETLAADKGLDTSGTKAELIERLRDAG